MKLHHTMATFACSLLMCRQTQRMSTISFAGTCMFMHRKEESTNFWQTENKVVKDVHN